MEVKFLQRVGLPGMACSLTQTGDRNLRKMWGGGVGIASVDHGKDGRW